MRPARVVFVAAVFGLIGSGLVASEWANADPLPAPANVRVTASSTSILRLAWDEVSGAPAYTVEYSKDSDFDPTADGTTTSTSISISGLPKQTTFYVRVRASATDQEALGDWSEPIQAKTGPMLIRIGSYNIKQPDKDTAACGNFAGRARDIVDSKVDVLGIQEAYQGSDRTDLMAAIRNAGGSTYAITLPEGPHGTDNGWDSRLVYNAARVDLIDSQHAAFATQDNEGTPREYVWATFELKSNRHRFIVYTTHLEPGGTVALKKAQWDEVRSSAAKKSVVDGKTLPVFITGDFNTSKFRQPADTMLPKMKSSGFGDVLGQTYRSYTTSGQRAKSKTYAYFNSFNDCKTKPSRVDKARIGNNIDWIFATNSLEIPAWRTYVHVNSNGTLKTPIASDHFLVAIQALLP
jgi:hypothetical protein